MQDRKTYAKGNTITTEGFRCSVGEPIDIKVTVGEDEEVDLQSEACKIIPNGDHLITLEVNGEKAAYRDLYHLGEDTVTVGGYTISDDMFLTGVSEDDEVVMRFEPVELNVTDAFRAAVKSLGGAASDSSGGGSGGVLVVNLVYDEDTGKTAFDKTWKEVYDADSVSIIDKNGSTKYAYIFKSMGNKLPSGKYVRVLNPVGNESTIDFIADSENGYPAAGL